MTRKICVGILLAVRRLNRQTHTHARMPTRKRAHIYAQTHTFCFSGSVLKEAEFIVATGNRRHLIYVKRGGIKQAKKDFQSLQPINVQTQKEGVRIKFLDITGT